MASYPSTSELFENWRNHKPESKLELIGGQLIVGNSLIGSKLLLQQILQGWKAAAAIALAPIETWLAALAAGYGAHLPDTNAFDAQLDSLEVQLAKFVFVPEDLRAGGSSRTWSHYQAWQQLTMDLFRLDGKVGGQSLGRDFVMRLGNNGFTPDLLFFKGQGLNQLHEAFLSGPAELVVEIVMPGHEESDRVLKYHHYQAAGVPECWLIDSDTQQVEFYRLIEGQYQPQVVESDGCYRPSSIPGLAFQPAMLWPAEEDAPTNASAFVVEQAIASDQRGPAELGAKWGSLLFLPNVQREATAISFEEYISWAPRAKFEFIQGKPLISSTPGTRNVLAMLLMTFGLDRTVRLLPPQLWIQGLRQRLDRERHDAEHKTAWWAIARQAADCLRHQFSVERLGVIGDLAMPQPLNYWSDITLVYWEKLDDAWRTYEALREIDPERRINLLRVDEHWLTADQLWQIEHYLVEL